MVRALFRKSAPAWPQCGCRVRRHDRARDAAFSLIGWPLLRFIARAPNRETERSVDHLRLLWLLFGVQSIGWRSKPAVDSNRAGGVRRLQADIRVWISLGVATRGASKATTLLQLRVFALATE